MFHEQSSISYFKFPAIHSADFAKAAQMSYWLAPESPAFLDPLLLLSPIFRPVKRAPGYFFMILN
ncbi:hypothetical protein [Acinetobacter sp.]|uniref:hypothetical protein n=1 Tax=Acinetobacter sp. TaxID=472 RepID=UPI002FC7E158